MGGTLEQSELHVEGPDDLHSIGHLLARQGIKFDPKVRLNEDGSVSRLLDGMAQVVAINANRAVGFVLDIDVNTTDRWRQVVGRLRPLGLEMPDSPPAEGFVGVIEDLNVRVGVWLMPDNSRDEGKLEHFLETLIPNQDPLRQFANESVDGALGRGAKFPKKDQIKALISTWLAWQESPGERYGIAIKAKYFRADSETALRFAAWFKRLYRIG